MLWTVIAYIVDNKSHKTPFSKTFYGSHEGKLALEDAKRLFGDEVQVIAIVAGNHVTSTFISEQEN